MLTAHPLSHENKPKSELMAPHLINTVEAEVLCIASENPLVCASWEGTHQESCCADARSVAAEAMGFL